MFKKLVLLTAIMFAGAPSVGFSAEPPPVVPTPTPIVPKPLDDKSVIVILDGKLVHATDVLNPVVSIEGADGPVGLGELVFLQAKLTQELPDFVKARVFKWTIPRHSFRENPDGSAFFGAGITPDTLPVKVDVSLTYQVGEELLIKTATKTINVQIGEPTPVPPNPTPGPDPTPTPTPPTPTLTDTQKAFYDIAMNTFGKELSTDDFKKAANVLGADFANCSKAISDGKYNSFKEFSDDLVATNRASVALLKLDLSKFDGFRKALHDWTLNYYNLHGVPNQNPGLAVNGDSSIKILNDWTKIIEDMAIGLKAAGQ